MSKEAPYNYESHYQQNKRCVEIINAVWGEPVAWLEDVKQPSGHTAPVIKTLLVRGCLPGRVHVPRFQTAPPARPRRLGRPRAPAPAPVAELEAPLVDQ